MKKNFFFLRMTVQCNEERNEGKPEKGSIKKYLYLLNQVVVGVTCKRKRVGELRGERWKVIDMCLFTRTGWVKVLFGRLNEERSSWAADDGVIYHGRVLELGQVHYLPFQLINQTLYHHPPRNSRGATRHWKDVQNQKTTTGITRSPLREVLCIWR